MKNFLRRIFKPKFLYFSSNSTAPISSIYGFDRGTPIDRYYIENFLKANNKDIKGRCLELLNGDYTKFFGKEKVTKSDILDIDANNTAANIIGDLRHLSEIKDETYDCIILTQVLQFIDNLDSAISECHRILKRGGVLLATLPCLSRIDNISGLEGDYWRFTKASASYVFQKKFNTNNIQTKTFGNVRAGIYFYAGIAKDEASKKVLRVSDPNFPLIVGVRAVK
jgi:SAM-dependent methyltransferase